MKKSILFLSLLCGLLFFSASCSDEVDKTFLPDVEEGDANGTDNSVITRLAWKDVEKTVAFLNEAKDIPVNIQLSRTGVSNTGTVTAGLSTLTQAELDVYNAEKQKAYILLPEEYYTLPATVEVAAGVKKQKVDMAIKGTVRNLADLNSKQYVVPVRLTSESCEVREGYDIAIVQLQATTPQFTLLESGIIGNTEVIISGLSIDITKKLNVSLNVDNRWNSKVVFVAEPDGLQELVDAYKQSSGEQDVKLLPAANYTLGTNGKLIFADTDESNKEVTITINSASGELTDGEYVLPVALASCEGMPFLVDKEKVCYYRFSVSTPKLSLKEKGLQSNKNVNRGEETQIKLNVNLNTGYQWEGSGSITFETNADVLDELVTAYNSNNQTAFSLLPAGNYTLPVSLSITKADGTDKEFSVAISPKDAMTPGEYLLPIVLKSCSNTAIEVNTEICYLLFTVTKQLSIKGKLTTNSEGVSQWANLPVDKLTDRNYYNATANDGYPNPGNTQNPGYWQSEWTFGSNNSIDKTKTANTNYDTTYGVYIDIDVSGFNLTSPVKLVMYNSRGNYPIEANIYEQGGSGDTWTKVQSIAENENLFSKTTIDGMVGGVYKTGISINKYESQPIMLTSEIKKLRISILKAWNNKHTQKNAMNTGTHKGEVSLDELELYTN